MSQENAPMTGEAVPFGPYLERWQWPNGFVQFVFHCPGCDGTHAYCTAKPASGEGSNWPVWTFNQNPDAPTFSPSLLNRHDSHVCHLFVTEGQIAYCGDCTHALAGKTVPMEKLA